MAGPLPVYGYLSSGTRIVSDMQSAAELVNSVVKQLLGAASEASTLSITSNTIIPLGGPCVLPVDQSGGGTINTIVATNLTDGQVIYIHSVHPTNPITIANNATGSGVPIATFSGQNIVLTNPAMFISLKYNQSLNQFQEMFPYTNLLAPGPIGSTLANTGAFTTLSVSSAITQTAGATSEAAPQNAGPIAAPADFMLDGIILGLTTYSSTGLTATLNTSPNSAGGYAVLVVQGNRVPIVFGASSLAITVSASKDTYIDVSSTGTFTATAVLNGANPPSITSNNLRLCKIVSGASTITSVTYLAPYVSAGAFAEYRYDNADSVLDGFSTSPTISSLTVTHIPLNGAFVTILQGGRQYTLQEGNSQLSQTVGASQDTYLDFSAGTFTANAVSNNATPPAISPAGALRVALIVSGASGISTGHVYYFTQPTAKTTALGAGPSIGTSSPIPTSGSWTGEYWQFGSLVLQGAITSSTATRIKVQGDVTIGYAITVNTEMAGGGGVQYLNSTTGYSFNGVPPGGLSPGQNGIVTNGGGGGGYVGAGGNGGSIVSGLKCNGGSAIPPLLLTGSGGGTGGAVAISPGTLNAGGAGGGGISIEASGNIYVLANITANGGAGTSTSTASAGAGGGGSGGAIELRAGGQIYIASGVTLSANGGAGGSSTNTTKGGASGGGSGGLIRLKAAYINNQGTLSVAGGTVQTGQTQAQTSSAGSAGVTDITAVVWGPRSAN